MHSRSYGANARFMISQCYHKPPLSLIQPHKLQNVFGMPSFEFMVPSLNCAVCCQASLDMVIHITCNRCLYCKNCFDKWCETNIACPHCRGTDGKFIDVITHARNTGNKWCMDLLNDCPTLCTQCHVNNIQPDHWGVHILYDCFKPCPNNCGSAVSVSTIIPHLKSSCEYRALQCQECGEECTYNEWNQHLLTCNGVHKWFFTNYSSPLNKRLRELQYMYRSV